MKIVAGLAVTLLFSSGAAAAINLDDVYGRYELAREKQGMCSQEVWVQEEDPTLETETPTVIIGQYYFPRVNAGSFEREDRFERATLRTYIAGNNLIFHKRSYDKVLGRKESQVTTAQFRGNLLAIKNQHVGVVGTTTECAYRRAQD